MKKTVFETSKVKRYIAIIFALLMSVILCLLYFVFLTEKTDPKINGSVDESHEKDGISLMSVTIPADDYAAYGISENAESAYEVTAVLSPENTTYKRFVWGTPAWESGLNGQFGANKSVTDYVTVSVSEDTQKAIVSCLQPFGEKIYISVSWALDTALTTQVCCRYVQHLETVSFQQSEDRFSLNGAMTISGGAVFSSVFTESNALAGEIPSYVVKIGVKPEFQEALIQEYGYPYFTPRLVNVGNLTVTEEGFSKELTMSDSAFQALFGESLFEDMPRVRFVSALRGFTSGHLLVSVTAEFSNGSSMTEIYAADIDPTAFSEYVYAESINLSDSDLYF